MGLNIEILALLVASAILCAMVVAASLTGISITARWDAASSDARQLSRERRALLLEVAVKVVLVFQLISLVAFVAVADRIHPWFDGAMCAVGTLGAHPLGVPTLAVKILVFVLSGLWLILGRAATGAYDAGLVRLKHGSLVLVAAALVLENILQFRYFLGLQPNVITSCCATVFSQNGRGIGSELAALPLRESRAAFFVCLALTAGAGLGVIHRGRSPALYSLASLLFAAVAVAALLSWIAPSVYELPTHHCPLCLIAEPHRLTGFLLYASLAVAVLTGAGAGLVNFARRFDAARVMRAGVERRLCAASLAGFALFSAVAVYPTVSNALLSGTF